MTIYFGDGTNQTTAADAAEIVQVQSGIYTGQTYGSIAGGAYYDLSSTLYAAITPTSSSNKIWIVMQIQCDAGRNGEYTMATLQRGSTEIGIGDASSSRRRITAFGPATDEYWQPTPINISYVDSPSTTSATTYSVKLGHSSSASTNIYLNSTSSDGDHAYNGRGISTITLMEIAS